MTRHSRFAACQRGDHAAHEVDLDEGAAAPWLRASMSGGMRQKRSLAGRKGGLAAAAARRSVRA